MKNNRRKNGYTLPEILSVVAIISVILVIAVPNIMNIIVDSKMSSLEITTKKIISSAEERYYENKVSGIHEKIKCEDLVNLKENEYGLCKISFDEEGNATVILNGKENGKFNNLACRGNKEEITCQEGEIKPGLNCTFDGELVRGAEYVNGQYTYRYKQEYFISSWMSSWEPISADGWGVTLTDKNSTDPVTTKVCSYINGRPIVSTSGMFGGSKATSIDLSGFDTSNVTDMTGMFYGSNVTSIDLRELDTSNVTNMFGMFRGSQIEELDLSSFDTKNVTSMEDMFFRSSVKEIKGLNNFDTSNVEDMCSMFFGVETDELDLSNFNTSKVTLMDEMFSYAKIKVLNLSSFNTSSVTDMNGMFYASQIDILDLSSFDTSKVTSMEAMFANSQTEELDLSSFDTSKVTVMDEMFFGTSATKGYARTQADADKFNASSGKPAGLVFTVK